MPVGKLIHDIACGREDNWQRLTEEFTKEEIRGVLLTERHEYGSNMLHEILHQPKLMNFFGTLCPELWTIENDRGHTPIDFIIGYIMHDVKDGYGFGSFSYYFGDHLSETLFQHISPSSLEKIIVKTFLEPTTEKFVYLESHPKVLAYLAHVPAYAEYFFAKEVLNDSGDSAFTTLIFEIINEETRFLSRKLQ